ncbi:MAG: glucose-1-phosphate thymidylyltransferase RfbA [Candidatus Omnitrophica bacterium]|nr:glucose-1-phosphate thymidylyltransferase RfbA [Candidatus Omnitrophota bacterium]
MKGIILAGGKATRLYPVTKGVCKQLLPVYDKPLIYYPLSVLMLAGIKDILIISTPEDREHFQGFFNDGHHLGVNISYAIQPQAQGIAQAFLIGEKFIGKERVALILGDNIFFGDKLGHVLREAISHKHGATVFGYKVSDPCRYGVISFDKNARPKTIIEKPKKSLSDWAVTGLYFYDHHVVDVAKTLKPSARGELEITDINQYYLKKNQLHVLCLSRGFAWLDTGTPDSLLDASIFIRIVEERQGLKIGCIEEVAFRMGFITKKQLKVLARTMNTSYGNYLQRIALNE